MHTLGRPPAAGTGRIALDYSGRSADAEDLALYYHTHYPSAAAAMSSSTLEGASKPVMVEKFRQRADLLRRLSPEALHAAGVGESAIFRLYRALRVYSMGFQEVLRDVTSHVGVGAGDGGGEIKAALLVDAWRLFARLWDGGCGVAFESDVVALAEARDANAAAAADLAERLDVSQREEGQLNSALDRMVRAQLEGATQCRQREDTAEANRHDLRVADAAIATLETKLRQREIDKERAEEATHAAAHELGQSRAFVASKSKECGKLHTALRKAQVEVQTASAQVRYVQNSLRESKAAAARAEAGESAAAAGAAEAAAAESTAQSAAIAVGVESQRIKMRITLLDADVEFKRGRIAELERTIKEKEVRQIPKF
jgi:hypothetical protein